MKEKVSFVSPMADKASFVSLEDRMLNFLVNEWPHFQRSFGKLEGRVAGLQWLTGGLIAGVLIEIILLLLR